MRAAPASSPIPCSTLNAPSGRPASCAMSASIEAVSGAHSGGLRITALPAASAGATRQVASINGAFHGVITAVTPLGSHSNCSANPSWSFVVAQRQQVVGEEPEVPRDARHDGVPHRPEQRPVVPRLDRGEFGDARLDAIGDPVQDLRSFLRGHRAPDGEPLTGGGDGLVGFGGSPAGDLGDGHLVDRRDVDEGLGRRDARAADPVVGGDLDALDDGVPRGDPLLASWDAVRPKVVRTRTVWPVPSRCQASGNRSGLAGRRRANDGKGLRCVANGSHRRW